MQRLAWIVVLGVLVGCSLDEPTTTTRVPPTPTTRRASATTVPATNAPPTPTYVPTAGGSVSSIPVPPTSTISQPTQTIGTGGETVLRFEDAAWTGSWRNRGDSFYGGRTATWIYGVQTQYNTMALAFELTTQPSGEAVLRIEGMDSEDRAKTAIGITVNGAEIFAGANPLPDDDQPLDSGTWLTASFPFRADLLVAGTNTITVQNRSAGTFGLPPFFMLDYAELVVSY